MLSYRLLLVERLHITYEQIQKYDHLFLRKMANPSLYGMISGAMGKLERTVTHTYTLMPLMIISLWKRP
jgi:hypothetical protein